MVSQYSMTSQIYHTLSVSPCRDDLREHLKDVQKQIMDQKQEVSSSDSDSNDSSSELLLLYPSDLTTVVHGGHFGHH